MCYSGFFTYIPALRLTFRYDALNTRIVERSITLGKQILVVSINYRYPSLPLAEDPSKLNVLNGITIQSFRLVICLKSFFPFTKTLN